MAEGKMTNQEKIPYFTRMLAFGVLMVIGAGVAHDIYTYSKISTALLVPGVLFLVVGLCGRIVTIVDS
jgi:hypothetical protein